MTATAMKVDSKGRLGLGKEFANALVLVTELPDGGLQIVRAEAVPSSEAWLHRNQAAMDSVMRGLEETAAGRFVEAPDLAADADIADMVKE